HRGEVSSAKSEQQALAGFRTRDPQTPAAAPFFGARQEARKDLVALRIVRPLIQFLEGGDLRRSEATIRFRGVALNRRRMEIACSRIVQNSVGHAVARVAGL